MGTVLTKERTPIVQQHVDNSVQGGAGSIHRSFLRERNSKANVEEYYEIISQIGRGGLCKVFRIKKKASKIGGTSRTDNVVTKLWTPQRRRKLVVERTVSSLSGGALEGGSFAGGHASTTTEQQQQHCELHFALKEINLALVAPEKVEQLKYEVEILKAFDHKNIIKAYETFQSSKKVMIVMELCTGGDMVSSMQR